MKGMRMMKVFKCSYCGVYGHEDDDPYGDWGPFACDCNQGSWEPAETETITNTIGDYV